MVDELLLVEGSDDAVEEWLVERAPSLTTLSLEREPGFATVVVPAAVRPFADVSTLLNTGGKRTEFVSAASRESTRARRSGLGAASAAPTSSARRPAPRRSGRRHELPVAQLAVRESMPDIQGMVGIDVLRGTVLACSADLRRRVILRIP